MAARGVDNLTAARIYRAQNEMDKELDPKVVPHETQIRTAI